MVIDVGYWKKVTKRLITFIMTILGIYLAFKLAVFYMPFLIAFIISFMVEPIIRKIAKKTKLRRKTSAIIVLILVFAIIVGLLIWGIAVLLDEGSNLLSSLNYYIDEGYGYITGYLDRINLDEIQVSDEVMGIAMVSSIGAVGIYTVITILATYFICADRLYILDQVEHHFPKEWVKKLSKNIKKIIELLGGYLKAEAILIVINFVLVLIRIIFI